MTNSLAVVGTIAAMLSFGCHGLSDDPLRPSRPASGEFVVDQANLIHAESLERMNRLLDALLREVDVEILALSVTSLEGNEILAFTQEIFEAWEVGDPTRANRGLLLVVAAEEQRVRLAVSYGLEGMFTDAFVSQIEHDQLAPYFQSGMVGEGIEATVELLARRAYEEIRGQAYDPNQTGPSEIGGFRAGGAGVETDVDLDGGGTVEAAAVDPSLEEYFGPQPAPVEAWNRFLEINRRRIKDPALGLYDAATRDHLRRRPNTNAGQQHIVRLYDGRSPTIRQQGDRAAILFPEDGEHLLAPWFFRRGVDGWQLDGGILPELIGYNHRNQWRFKTLDHPYMFAFGDYRFDRNGFGTWRNE